MKDQLIQSLNAYTTALEQKLSALEQRVAQLEEAIRLKGDEAVRHEENIAALKAEVAALTTAGIAAVVAEAEQPIAENEPEVEIELIVDEEALLDLPVNLDISDSSDLSETPDPVEEPEAIETPVTPMAEETPVAEPTPIVEPVAPVVEPTKEQALHNTTQPLQTSLFGAAVEDIRQAISLGDRFLFQRELFAGNGELMQKTLDEINALSSLDDAMDYVLDNFDWDKESTAVQLFENVLKRRFN